VLGHGILLPSLKLAKLGSVGDHHTGSPAGSSFVFCKTNSPPTRYKRAGNFEEIARDLLQERFRIINGMVGRLSEV
jgi:hypothetical protein